MSTEDKDREAWIDTIPTGADGRSCHIRDVRMAFRENFARSSCAATKAIEEHNAGCDEACKARRAGPNGEGGCGYQNSDGSLIYGVRRCPECPLDWKIAFPESAPSKEQP